MYGGENVTVRHEEFACEMKVTVAVTFLVGIIQVYNYDTVFEMVTIEKRYSKLRLND